MLNGERHIEISTAFKPYHFARDHIALLELFFRKYSVVISGFDFSA